MAYQARRTVATLLILAAVIGTATASVASVCEKLSPASENVGNYGLDHRPRIGFQVSDADVSCVIPLAVEAATEMTLYAWNLGLGISGASFRLVSNGDIEGFTPGSEFGLVGSSVAMPDGTLTVIDVELAGLAECGPVELGTIAVSPTTGSSGVYVDIDGYAGTGTATLFLVAGPDVPAISPFHGAYAGDQDLYHCQPALCAEPLAAITDLSSVQSGGTVIELGWTAGEGDATMIRYRSDGEHPTSIYDGELLVAFPAVAGQWQSIVHTNPEVPEYWYTAFSVRLDGSEVTQSSLLECGSFTTASVDESISNETLSWGAFKQRFR